MSYLFQNATAFDPYTGQGVPNATGQVYAMADTAFATPLTVILLSSGLQTTELVSDQYSQLPGFDAGDNVQVRFRSGEFVKVLNTSTPLVGPQGLTGKSAFEVAVEGGYTGTEAEYNATLTDAPSLVARAETAEAAAVNAANLVGAPADTAIAMAINGPGTQTATALNAAIVERLPYLNVADYGAKGDGVTDDRAAIQAALDAAGNGGVVQLSAKRYRIVGSLITNTWQRLEGVSATFGSGSTSPVELVFAVSGSTPGIRARSYTHLKNLLIRGPGDVVGTCVGVQMFDAGSNSISLEDVSIDDWAVGAHLHQVYYGKFSRATFRRNAVGLKITSSLNISLFGVQVNAQRADGTPGVGIQGTARALNIFGGSVEQCSTFISMTNDETLNLFGVYFETTIGTGHPDIRGVNAGGSTGVTINAYGCYVYMPFIKSWIDLRTSLKSSLNARGNTFIAGSAVESPGDAVAYRFTGGQLIDIGGDNWTKVEKPGIVYFGSTFGTMPAKGVRLSMPAGHANEGLTYDGRIDLVATDVITHSVEGPGTITIGYERVQVNLTANMPSLTITGTAQDRQRIEITFIQDATGGRVYGFNGFCRFAGGVAPINTTANTRTTVGIQYEASTGRWHETHRTVAVPNS